MTMTERGAFWDLGEGEQLCLGYLGDLMWTDAHAVGRFIRTNRLDPRRHGSNFSSVGAAVLGRLRKKELVAFLPDIEAWRITDKGRRVLRDDVLGESRDVAKED